MLFVVPWLDTSPVRSARFRPVFRVFFWILVADCVLLTYAGGQPPEGIWLVLIRLARHIISSISLWCCLCWQARKAASASGQYRQPALGAGRADRSLASALPNESEDLEK